MNSAHLLFQSRFRFFLVLTAAALLVGSGIMLAFGMYGEWGSNTLLLLHFDRFGGADFFGFSADALSIWLFGIGLFFLNLLLSLGFARRVPLASFILLCFNILFSSFLFLYIVSLLRVN